MFSPLCINKSVNDDAVCCLSWAMLARRRLQRSAVQLDVTRDWLVGD